MRTRALSGPATAIVGLVRLARLRVPRLRGPRAGAPAVFAVVLVSALGFAPAAMGAGSTNPIQAENAKPGDSFWTHYLKRAPQTEIAGYTSEVSIAPGGTLQLHVSSSQSYRIEIDRLGWYGGRGGRRDGHHLDRV